LNRLILIRHAESEHQIQGLTGGRTDTPLSPCGNVQARLVANRCGHELASETSVRVFSSDLLRAAQTAECVAQALKVECRFDPGLRELNNGIAANLNHAEAKRIERLVTEPAIDWVPYPEAETWRKMTERVFACMDHIERTGPSTAVVVTHGNSGVAIIQWWLRMGDCCRRGISFELENASWSEFAINAWEERTIVRLNDTGHLYQST
jgi:broad specificity phosphatase PhoE